MYSGSKYVCPQCSRGLVSGMTLLQERPIREYRCWCGYRTALSKRATNPRVSPIANAAQQSA